MDYVVVQASGMPNYSTTLTQADVDQLKTRPNAATDFEDGVPSVDAGDTVRFGESVGYAQAQDPGGNSVGCELGYWPPGPECPSAQELSFHIPVNPSLSEVVCETAAGAVGFLVNGVALYYWTGDQSYNGAGTWRNVAAAFELYDLDICAGHSGFQGQYHHHFSTDCLAADLNDTGDGHSPVYGYAADGYPIYGPYEAEDTLATSCWTARDYEDESDPYGCGGTGQRTCLMADP